MILPSQDAKFGDYQANLAMPLGKQLGKPPREIAQQIVAKLDVADDLRATGSRRAGFINLRLKDSWIVEQVAAAAADLERLGVEAVAKPRTYVVDYSSPNVAKPMHVGHIRSTVIGDALNRVLKFLGHETISDNHLGDWGTQFGMIIYGYKHFVDEAASPPQPVAELSRLYKLVHALVDYRETQRAKIPALERQIAEAEQRLAKLDDARGARRSQGIEESCKATRASEAGPGRAGSGIVRAAIEARGHGNRSRARAAARKAR